jgi:hypothetical protein
MADPESDNAVGDDDARTRWMVINLTRLAGVAMVLVGILGVSGRIGLPDVASYLFLAAGLFDIFAVPQILARKWRTPNP